MKDGYEYVLRFGGIASSAEGTTENKLNRYLFVTARVDDSKFPPPDLEPEPVGPATFPVPESAPKKEEGKNGDGAADVEPKKDAKEPAAPKTEKKTAESPAVKKDDGKEPAKDGAQDDKKGDEKKTEEKKSEEKKPDPKAELERIRKENERKLNDWKEKKKKANDQVADLNARFADWYYVISEDTYKNIHLGRADIIKEKAAAKDEGFGADAFRKLETDGPKKPATPPPGPPGHPGMPPGMPGRPRG